jgi:hypothetical protein
MAQTLKDTCTPKEKLRTYTFRIYSIVVPALVFFLLLETVFVFAITPSKFGLPSGQ